MRAGNENAASMAGYVMVGALLGGLSACLFSVADTIGAFVAGQEPIAAGEFASLTAEAMAVFVPVGVALGAGGAAGLYALRRAYKRGYALALGAAPLVLLAGLFAYGAVWHTSARGGLGYVAAARWAVAAIVGAFALHTGAKQFARGILDGRRGAVLFAGGLVAVFWVASVVQVAKPEVAGGLPDVVESADTGRPNVLLVVLDTVRADHMSCYGYTRNTTPNVDGLAADGRLYTNVLSPSCWTLPSHASMFTGLPNSAHGCNWSHPYLDEDFETIAEKLQQQGYQTGGFSSNPVVSAPRGFAQGFERFWVPQESKTRGYTFLQRFRDRFGEQEPRPVAPDMHAAVGEWFRDDYEPDRPFFVFLNYIEPHAPYSPRSHALEWATPEMARRWRSRDQIDLTHRYIFGLDVVSAGEMGELETLYDEEIAFVDRKVGELLDLLRRSGLYDNTCIIVTSDHGEHFGEHHLMGHQFSLYEPLVRVPLIVRHPSSLEPGRDGALVQTNDVFATVLDIAGVEWRARAEHDSLNLLAGEERSEAYSEHLAPAIWRISRFSDTLPTVDTSRIWRRLRAVQRGDVKMIRSFEGECELYDLGEDPLETRDLAAESPETVTQLEQVLARWTGSFEHYVPKPLTAETLRQLSGDELEAMRGLGYIR